MDKNDLKRVAAGAVAVVAAATTLSGCAKKDSEPSSEPETINSQVTEEVPTAEIFDRYIIEPETTETLTENNQELEVTEVKARYNSLSEYEEYLKTLKTEDSWVILENYDVGKEFRVDHISAAALDVLNQKGIGLEQIIPTLETMLIMSLNPTEYNSLPSDVQRIVDIYGEKCNAFCVLQIIGFEIYMEEHPTETFYQVGPYEIISKELNDKMKALNGLDSSYYDRFFEESLKFTK